ncbi:MAG: hypothetical protein AAGC73_06830 [Verrucomicrobiota bacterium]
MAALALAGLPALSAYEQGSYFIFEIVQDVTTAEQGARLSVSADLFAEEKASGLLAETNQENSEFEFRPEENFGLGQASGFGTNQNFSLGTEETEVAPIQMIDFSLTQQSESNVFGQ